MYDIVYNVNMAEDLQEQADQEGYDSQCYRGTVG